MGQRPGSQRANEDAGPIGGGTGAKIGQNAKTADRQTIAPVGPSPIFERQLLEFARCWTLAVEDAAGRLDLRRADAVLALGAAIVARLTPGCETVAATLADVRSATGLRRVRLDRAIAALVDRGVLRWQRGGIGRGHVGQFRPILPKRRSA